MSEAPRLALDSPGRARRWAGSRCCDAPRRSAQTARLVSPPGAMARTSRPRPGADRRTAGMSGSHARHRLPRLRRRRSALTFCDLGAQPRGEFLHPAGAARGEPEPRFPLRAVVCDDCRLVQLDTVVDERGDLHRLRLFLLDLLDLAGPCRALRAAMTQRLGLGAGTLRGRGGQQRRLPAAQFRRRGHPCLGVEPAANVAAIARAAGVPTEARFFGARRRARPCRARRGHADLVVGQQRARACARPRRFRRRAWRCWQAGAAWSRSRRRIWSRWSMACSSTRSTTSITPTGRCWRWKRCWRGTGLRVFDVERLATHGGSLRVFSAAAERGAARDAWRRCGRRKPRAAWMTMPSTRLRRRACGRRWTGCRAWLGEAAAEGRRVCAYGAAAKGNTC